MTDLDNDIRLGREAGELLKNEAFVRAIAQAKEGIMTAWAASPIRDKDGQHELRLMLKALTTIEGCLKTAISSGKIARIEVGMDD